MTDQYANVELRRKIARTYGLEELVIIGETADTAIVRVRRGQHIATRRIDISGLGGSADAGELLHETLTQLSLEISTEEFLSSNSWICWTAENVAKIVRQAAEQARSIARRDYLLGTLEMLDMTAKKLRNVPQEEWSTQR